ncbi:MAG TPA: M23 family metallopeptidase [Thermoanaerobaculia bacterium]|nr:M23 family metallopeptidase [Thermoanaerobaculia bacterium]
MSLTFLAAAVLAALEAPAPAPGLTVRASPATPLQGGVTAITITSKRPLAALELVDGDTRFPLERTAGGTTFRGLYGVDLAAASGAHRVVFEAPDGAQRLAWTLKIAAGRFSVQRLSVNTRYVEVPKEEQERIKADQARVEEAYRRGSAVRLWTSFARPVNAPSQGNFGARRVYNGKTRSSHAGLDLAAGEGTPVAAAADGRVVLAGDLYFSGGTVLLDHGAGLFTQYFHLSRIDVKEGDTVAKGARLGASGHTGRVTGPHLHWGAKLFGARVNPEDLLALDAWPLPGAEPRPVN